MLRDEGCPEVDVVPSGKTVFCRWLCASLNTLLNVRPTVAIVISPNPAMFRSAFKALCHRYSRTKLRLRLGADGWMHVLLLRKTRHDEGNDGMICI